jgi:hypothetical protein
MIPDEGIHDAGLKETSGCRFRYSFEKPLSELLSKKMIEWSDAGICALL